MSKNNDIQFSKWLYKVGVGIILVLSVVALIAFIKALSPTDQIVEGKIDVPSADSVQIEALQREVQNLNKKVDSVLVLTRKEPQKVYRYIKPKKDSCTIEVNIHNK